MSKPKKKRFFLNHKKSSAMVISITIHVLFLVLALSFVAVKVIIKEDQTFEVKEVKRPAMKLRKLQVPVKEQKKTQAPKLRKTIVAKPKNPTVDIKMPEIVGVKGGTGYGRSGGLGGLGFGFEMDLFGSGRRSGDDAEGAGTEFVGTFYDLKQTPEGEPTKIGDFFAENGPYGAAEEAAIAVVKRFLSSWNTKILDDFFKAPKLKYSTAFMMPVMDADQAPKAFGVDDQVNPSFWLCHYVGQIAAPETGQYRFCGLGDDVLAVRVKGRLVLDACWHNKIGLLTNWSSNDGDNRRYPLDGDTADSNDYLNFYSTLVLGDWFTLKKGERVDVEILLGELPGTAFSCRLLVQQKGKEYKMVPYSGGERPVLPIFKTAPIDSKILGQMRINPKVATAEGPVFDVLTNANKPDTGRLP